MEHTTMQVIDCTHLKQSFAVLSHALLSDIAFCQAVELVRNQLQKFYPDKAEQPFAVMDRLRHVEWPQGMIVQSYELYRIACFLINGGAEEIAVLHSLD